MPALTTTYSFSKPLGPDLFLSGHIVALGANWDELDDLLSGAMNLELRAGAVFTINDSSPAALFTLAEATGLATFTGVVRANTGFISGATDSLHRDLNNQSVLISGGNAASAGAHIEIFGGTHGSLADDIVSDADEWIWRSQDGLTTRMQYSTGGQLRIPTVGSAAGIVLGGDAQWFRGAVNRMDLASGDDLNVVDGDVIVNGSVNATQFLNVNNASGQARLFFTESGIGNTRYQFYYTSTSSYLSVHKNINDAVDIWRINDTAADLSIDANTSWDDNAFDYVCECGTHSADPFYCSQCETEAVWQDDVLTVSSAIRGDELAVRRMQQQKILRTHKDGWRAISVQNAQMFTFSAMRQLYDRQSREGRLIGKLRGRIAALEQQIGRAA